MNKNNSTILYADIDVANATLQLSLAGTSHPSTTMPWAAPASSSCSAPPKRRSLGARSTSSSRPPAATRPRCAARCTPRSARSASFNPRGEAAREYLRGLRLEIHPDKCRALRCADGVDFRGFVVRADGRVCARAAGMRRFARRYRWTSFLQLTTTASAGPMLNLNAAMRSWFNAETRKAASF